VLFEPRHQFDEIAGPEAIVELVLEDLVPAVAAGAGRAGQREQVVPPATPPVQRDWMVEEPIFARLIQRNISPKPSIRFS